MNTDQSSSNHGKLTDSDLDQLLAAANEELLAHVKAVADPTPTLVAIMAHIAPAAPTDDAITPAVRFADRDAGRRDGIAAIPAWSMAVRSSKQEDDGELTGFAALYVELAPGLIRYLRWMMRSSSGLAEDVAQDAFLVLIRKWPDIHNRPNLKAWLYKVARDLAFVTLEKRSREFLLEEFPDDLTTGRDDPSDSYDMGVVVKTAVSKLPSRQREAVWFYYFHDLKQTEIAEIMQIQRAAVGALLFQARRRLAELLGAREYERST